MAQSSPQFTAAQVLEAGQQADAGGNRDYAIQFYRHIVDHHPGSSEAVLAREGLLRLLGHTAVAQAEQRHDRATQEPVSKPALVNASYAAARENSANQISPMHNGYSNQHKTTTGPAPQRGSPEQPMQQQNGLQGSALVPAAETDPNASAIPKQFFLPAQYDHYRTGRYLAICSGLLGWLVLCLGFVAAAAGTGLIPGLTKYVDMVPGLIYGAAALFAGLLMIFASQLAQAIFDNANATRDLAAIERAKVRQSQTHE